MEDISRMTIAAMIKSGKQYKKMPRARGKLKNYQTILWALKRNESLEAHLQDDRNKKNILE